MGSEEAGKRGWAALYDFGGTGPLVHLAHANGFPPGTYRPFVRALTSRFRVVGLPARPLWPGSRPEEMHNWHLMADDLIRGLDELGARGIFGIGHSMGGVATLWAAVRRPDIFRAVVLIDPVILPPTLSIIVRWLRRAGINLRRSMIQQALRRRRVWSSRRACFERYRTKPHFARWSDECLWAYVEAVTHERPDGQVELAYPPEWEARIYATVPTDVWKAIPRLHLPTLVVRGELSQTFLPQSLAAMRRRLPHARFAVIPEAGHLVPMERPEEAGRIVREFLEKVGKEGSEE